MPVYLAALRHLARHCEFEDWLDRLLCDRLVCGLRDETLQRRLLAEPELTLTKAVQMARAAEEAAVKTEELRRTRSEARPEQNRVAQAPRKPPSGSASANGRSAHVQCWRCTGSHDAASCSFASVVCHFCGNKGHLQKACRKKAAKEKKKPGKASERPSDSERRPRGRNHQLTEATNPPDQDVYHVTPSVRHTSQPVEEVPVLQSLSTVSSVTPAVFADVAINGHVLSMEVDSGSACTVISSETFRVLDLTTTKLRPSPLQLQSYTHERLDIMGTLEVDVTYKTREARLPLLVVKGTGTSLLGRDWFPALGIGLSGVKQLSEERTLRQQPVSVVVAEFPEVFKEGLGKSKGLPVRIEVAPAATPRFLKARQVPVALRPRVEAAIDILVEQGVYQPVRNSRWSTPVVPVVKKNGKIRLCGDYKCTVNPALQWETYPLPTTEQLFANLAGCKVFSRLDLDQAYQQLTVDDETADLLTVNTHRGLFRVTRLPFGVATAVAIFQRYMEELLAGLPMVHVYLDDIIVGGRTEEEHHRNLRAVLNRIQEDGVRLSKDKCAFGVSEVVFLGYRIDSQGIYPTEEKVKALKEAPAPKDKQQLQSFLGLLNFYNRFLRGAAHTLEPLHRLLGKDSPWRWGPDEDHAFINAKMLLESSAVLRHYDVHKPLVLACDASPYGLGFVLSHEDQPGLEAPVAYGSRTMTPTERNYSQTDREALAVVSGVKKFHQYLYGRHFKIYTDHKPLLGLLHHSKPIPAVLSPRLLRWNLLLGQYDYELVYRPGRQMGNADSFSRLPLPTKDFQPPPLEDVLLLEAAPEVPVDAERIARLTKQDPKLSRVLRWIKHGWPDEKPSEEFQPYYVRRDELSAYRDCILWGSRVVVPPSLRPEILKILHSAHPGMVRMKGLARGYVWWPGLDKGIEEQVRTCATCQVTRDSPPQAPVHPWECSSRPWSRLHVDFAGPFQGKTFFLVVDSYSKWLEVRITKSTSATTVVRELRRMFATHGLPDVVVSDNGPAFASEEFRTFLARNNIRQALVSPYHPSSNGQAERFVQDTKKALRRLRGADIDVCLTRFLFEQHILPSTSTGRSPAELMMSRQLRSALDSVHPDHQRYVEQRQEKHAQSSRTTREFCPGDSVFARSFALGRPRWIPAVVYSRSGPVSYQVKLQDGTFWKRHVDHIRRRTSDMPDIPDTRDRAPDSGGADLDPQETRDDAGSAARHSMPGTSRTETEETPAESRLTPAAAPGSPSPAAARPTDLSESNNTPPTALRRSSRTTRHPAHLKEFV